MLREDQVQRYSRQILLREVGGVGQERLLSRPVELRTSGPAFAVAAAYLAAGGTPVRLAAGVTLDGFFAGAALEAFNPDVASPHPTWATLGAVSSPRAATDVELVLAGDGLAWRDGATCRDCFAAAIAQLDPGDTTGPTLAGSLAALALQRLALGLESSPGVMRFAQGSLAPLARCALHGG